MKVKIGDTTYKKIVNLSFDPSTDVVGATIAINEFEVDIQTDDTIAVGQTAKLYDDRNNLWAKYWIIYAERINDDFVRVLAQSNIALLERKKLSSTMYSGDYLIDVLEGIFGASSDPTRIGFDLDSSLSYVEITGYCPEQSARDRLLWLCFVAGAYIKTYFNTDIQIKPVDETETTIPINKIYWKPSITHGDYITAVKVMSYTFTAGTPQSTDEWVKTPYNTYIVTSQEHTLINPDVPENAPENEISVEGVMLVNGDNVGDILSHMAKYYFPRTQVDLDIINNAEYMPGEKLTVYTDDETLVTGYAESFTFTFGVQAKARVNLIASAMVDSGNLIIIYKYDDKQIGKKRYNFPVGYQYSIANPYIDLAMNGHRYVFRPENEYATGTMTTGTNRNTQEYQVALDLNQSTHILHTISVDDVTVEEQGEVPLIEYIGVIS